eukprot:ANDGO_05325.mRNA.1 putative serine/threonine-protein kinase nek2
MTSLLDFELESVLGQGTYGRVYKGFRKSDHRSCVLKEVSLDGLSPRDREDALNESKILAQCDHFNIVKYLSSFIQQNVLYIVMDFAGGGDLAAVIKTRYTKPSESANAEGIDEDMVWNYLIQVCQGLKYLHDKRILHRDLKPANVFLDENNNVKIGDMGLGRLLGPHSQYAMTGVGTPLYFSPEICMDRPYNEKSDIWALGCIVYEMCTGLPPFIASNQIALAKKICNDPVPPISGTRYSSELQFLVSKMLEKDPTKRPDVNQVLGYHGVQIRIERARMRHREIKLRDHYLQRETQLKADYESRIRELERKIRALEAENVTLRMLRKDGAPSGESTPSSGSARSSPSPAPKPRVLGKTPSTPSLQDDNPIAFRSSELLSAPSPVFFAKTAADVSAEHENPSRNSNGLGGHPPPSHPHPHNNGHNGASSTPIVPIPVRPGASAPAARAASPHGGNNAKSDLMTPPQSPRPVVSPSPGRATPRKTPSKSPSRPRSALRGGTPTPGSQGSSPGSASNKRLPLFPPDLFGLCSPSLAAKLPGIPSLFSWRRIGFADVAPSTLMNRGGEVSLSTAGPGPNANVNNNSNNGSVNGNSSAPREITLNKSDDRIVIQKVWQNMEKRVLLAPARKGLIILFKVNEANSQRVLVKSVRVSDSSSEWFRKVKTPLSVFPIQVAPRCVPGARYGIIVSAESLGSRSATESESQETSFPAPVDICEVIIEFSQLNSVDEVVISEYDESLRQMIEHPQSWMQGLSTMGASSADDSVIRTASPSDAGLKLRTASPQTAREFSPMSRSKMEPASAISAEKAPLARPKSASSVRSSPQPSPATQSSDLILRKAQQQRTEHAQFADEERRRKLGSLFQNRKEEPETPPPAPRGKATIAADVSPATPPRQSHPVSGAAPVVSAPSPSGSPVHRRSATVSSSAATSPSKSEDHSTLLQRLRNERKMKASPAKSTSHAPAS